MIYGIGVDTIEVPRIEHSLAHYGNQFIERIFSDEEIRYCSPKPHRAEHFAARFAAKEAYAKALGTGVRRGFIWKEASVGREPSGRPFIRLSERMMSRAERIIGQKCRIYLTLTHTKSVAEAVVIIEVDQVIG